MRYLHASSDNYEDFASGRVLHHAPGLTNFPVRLAQEIFMRAASRLPTASPVCLYDGCCGSGYLLTVLGLLNQAKIHRIIGRDINQQAIEVAKRNLSLLSHKGLAQRRLEIERHLSEFRRPSYQQALASLDRIAGQLFGPEIEIDLDRGDLFDPQPLQWPPDIVFMDLPYGRLTAWQTDQSTQIRSNDQDNLSVALLLQSLSRQISRQTIVALSMDRNEKWVLSGYRRLEQQIIGHRKFVICQLDGPSDPDESSIKEKNK